MNDFFCEYLDDFIICYIDDTLIFSKNMEDHEHHLHFVSEKFQKVGFCTKLQMSEFHQFEMKLLGYVISWDDIHIDPHKVQTIWRTPKSRGEPIWRFTYVELWNWDSEGRSWFPTL
jgi:hypothetical protein